MVQRNLMGAGAPKRPKHASLHDHIHKPAGETETKGLENQSTH